MLRPQEFYLGRQPIYDCSRDIRAYELLFRSHATGSAGVTDGDRATAEVLVNAILELGLDQVSPQKPAFVNCTRHFLKSALLIPPDRCVLEILEDIDPDAEIVEASRRLHDRGYRIALDDFVYRPEYEALLEISSFVKVDISCLSTDQLRDHARLLRRHKAELLAEKIESEPQLKLCQDLGFTLFQGYYLRRPEILRGRRLPTARLSALSVVLECRSEDQSSERISRLIARDVTLTHSLLQLVNSGIYGRSFRINSLTHAVSLLGADCISRWVTVLLLAGCNHGPNSYIEYALHRACTCEIIASQTCGQGAAAYLVGLLSVLDAVFNVPLPEIVGTLPLDSHLKAALLNREGELGRILSAVIAYESADLAAVENHGLDVGDLRKAFWRAGALSSGMFGAMGVPSKAESQSGIPTITDRGRACPAPARAIRS
jgi:EAL and modified HD-GYP domain-containing signal transduction protein